MDLRFSFINVFASSDDRFSGNPICLFHDAGQLSREEMLQLSAQVNVETVFLLSHSAEGARMRFFAPQGEAKFAGSASLGAAHVINQMYGDTRVPLRLIAEGLSEVDVTPVGKDNWEVQARDATTRTLKSTPQILASMVGLPIESLSGDPMIVNSGRSCVILPVATAEDVRDTHLDARLLHSYAMLLNTEPQVYVWAQGEEDDVIESRMFYGPRGGVLEVAATGSGAANLGHSLAVRGEKGITKRIRQGAAVGRPSVLGLRVDDAGNVFVSGHVDIVAEGTFNL